MVTAWMVEGCVWEVSITNLYEALVGCKSPMTSSIHHIVDMMYRYTATARNQLHRAVVTCCSHFTGIIAQLLPILGGRQKACGA